jgi:hypothetical protein
MEESTKSVVIDAGDVIEVVAVAGVECDCDCDCCCCPECEPGCC